MTTKHSIILLFLLVLTGGPAVVRVSAQATAGYDLWLRYLPVEDQDLLQEYSAYGGEVCITDRQTRQVISSELRLGFGGMLGLKPKFTEAFQKNTTTLLISQVADLPAQIRNQLPEDPGNVGPEGFIIYSLPDKKLVITAPGSQGLIYGTFHLLRLMQMHRSFADLFVKESPAIERRVLNHWDNLDRTVERGYAGFSIWNWQTLPDYIDQRYVDYARANASIGINGTVLTNVNANALVLTPAWLKKVAALADVFRPYGIKVYLTARFSAPIEIGGLNTADPLDSAVRAWWNEKVMEIYSYIPDFGGFVVKANSEGQPGPQNFGRTHADGANLLASALLPYQGIVMWRAFVYSDTDPEDRAKQAYSEFMALDGKFMENVIVQVKNGPIDFQPREPFHPLFGAMKETPIAMEFQITQEYLGFSTHLVFLPRLFEEVLQTDTYRSGTVSEVIKDMEGRYKLTGIAGVANIGTDFNWTGHPIGQANWYGYGRLAWDPDLSSEKIAEEWLRSTFSNEKAFLKPMVDLLMTSREAVVHYMTPLGLHHIMDANHHYGPGPWVDFLGRPEWNSVYYHQADSAGIGFDRTINGSNALGQYGSGVISIYEDPATCPKEYLLWFHHLPWTYDLGNGRNLWEEIGLTYQQGVEEVRSMQQTWNKMEPFVNEESHRQVSSLLQIQLKEAVWWKNACMSYFKEFSQLPYPEGMEKPDRELSYYKSLKFPYAPGIRPQW